MNTKELRSSISFHISGYGHWKVKYTTPQGKVKSGTTTHSEAIDRINNVDMNEKEQGHYGMTLKQALLSLKSVCK